MSSGLPQFGRYQAQEVIGRGGMGVVYRANDPLIDRDVAVKTIALEDDADDEERSELLGRIVREIRAAGSLSHPHIARVHDVGETDGELFIVMELCSGPTLEALIEKGLEPGRAYEILSQTAAALDYAHAEGVIHRDVKPGNILTDSEGRAKLVDFGIAKTLAGSRLTRTGMMVGTPEYMAPEQLEDEEAGPAADQYALAVTAYEAFTGRLPFDADTISELLSKVLRENPPPAKEAAPGAAKALRRGLAKDPEKRFANCAEFTEALAPEAAGEGPPESTGRRRWVSALAGAAVVLLGAAYLAFQPAPVEAPAVEQPDPAEVEAPSVEPSVEPAVEAEAEPDPPPGQSKRSPAAASPPGPRGKTQREAPPKPAPERPAAPALAPSGPVIEVVWRGDLAPDATLSIVDGRADSGELSQPLPTTPYSAQVSPPDSIEVVTPPSEANDWSRLVVRNRGRARRLFLIRYQSLAPAGP